MKKTTGDTWFRECPELPSGMETLFSSSAWVILRKGLRRLGLTEVFFWFCKPLCKLTKVPDLSFRDAWAILEGESPKPHSSGLWNWEIAEGSSWDLDIIIPCYNVENYVESCVQSILQQNTTYRCRLILIDDGSMDRTGRILDSFRTHPACMVLHQENKGFSGARNTGLRQVQAPYVMFVDSDDRLPPGSIQAMMDAAVKHNCGMVQGGIQTMGEEGEILAYRPQIPGEFSVYDDLKGYAWGKVIKSAYFQQICFPPQLWYEDMIIRHLLYPLLRRNREVIYGVDVPVYQYRQNPTGISKTGGHRAKCVDTVWVTVCDFEDRKTLGIANCEEDLNDFLLMAIESVRRLRFRPQMVQLAAFVVFSDLLRREFPGITPTKYGPLYRAMMRNAYGQFRLYAKLIM